MHDCMISMHDCLFIMRMECTIGYQGKVGWMKDRLRIVSIHVRELQGRASNSTVVGENPSN